MFNMCQGSEGLLACWDALVPGIIDTDNSGVVPVLKIAKENYFAISIYFLTHNTKHTVNVLSFIIV